MQKISLKKERETPRGGAESVWPLDEDLQWQYGNRILFLFHHSVLSLTISVSLFLSCPSVSPWGSYEDIPYIWFLFLTQLCKNMYMYSALLF